MSTRIKNLVSPDLASLILGEASGRQVWLVGGAIRDFFLEYENPDLDFAVENDAAVTARNVADRLGVPYFVLDGERDTARVLTTDSSTLDFARLRAETIEMDLELRDFTINACAIDLSEPTQLIDPLGGLQDVRDGVLRACAADSIAQDPIRALRGIRLAAGLNLQLDSATKHQIRAVGNLLAESAAERRRDEISKLFEMDEAAIALRLARRLDVVQHVLPELSGLSEDPWDQSLRIVESLIELINAVATRYKPEGPGNLRLAELSLRIGRYRSELEGYLSSKIRGGHQVRQILLLAALYSILEEGADVVRARARALRFSEAEATRARAILLNKDRLAGIKADAPDLAIHRFYRESGDVGVDSVLLHIAGAMASEVPQEDFERTVSAARRALEAWFESFDQIVNPPRLIRGDELADKFDLEGSPIIGTLLPAIAEGQVSGRVQTKADGFDLARGLLEEETIRPGGTTTGNSQG